MPLPTLAWDFNGTTTDYVSRVIPVSSAGFSYSTGKYQQGASFTNTVGSAPTNYIVYDFTAISSAAFTVCCWVNTVASAGGGIAVSIAGGNREGDVRIFLGGTSPGNILTQYRMLTTPPSTYTYVNALSATNSVVAGVWNHVAVTITESADNGTVLSCFFNGSLASTTTSAYGAPRNLNGMGVGAFYSLLFNNGYNGLIDDLRIFDRALTAAQVSSIWAQQGVPGRGVNSKAVPTFTVSDQSQNPLTLSTYGTLVTAASSPFGGTEGCLSNCAITIPPSVSKTNFNFFASNCFAEWFFYSAGSASGYPRIFSRGQYPNEPFWIEHVSPGNNLLLSGFPFPQSYPSFTLNQWNHFSYSFNSQNSTLYYSINGTVTSNLVPTLPTHSSSDSIYINCGVAGQTDMKISNFRLVQNATTLPYITNGFTVPTAPISIYPSGTTALLLRSVSPLTMFSGGAIQSATGGDTVQDIGGYRIHTFTTVGTSTFTPATSGLVEVLVVAGGGSGGVRHSGGGGAGGLIYNPSFPVSGAVTVTVGDGGAARLGTAGSGPGNSGSNSVFGSLTAIGGGYGNAGAGGSGGSGGGTWNNNPVGAGTAGQGNNGAFGSLGPFSNENTYGGGGGGGAGAPGTPSTSVAPVTAGSGGNGLQYSISGTPVYYAGGGGGSTTTTSGSNAVGGNGGLGGGGAGSGLVNGILVVDGIAGTNGTGGGGGAGGWSNPAGANYSSGKGGSGIVIVRYPLPVRLTGTPLFTQLSTSATSSAVGAFSLRAVNGTSVKAVQVAKYTLLTVPPVALTQNTFTATGTFNGVTNGQYVALCSRYNATSDAYRVFDQNPGTRGTTSGTEYTVGTGAYIGSASTVDSTSSTYNGAWFQIRIPSEVNAVSYSVTVHSGLTLTAPYTWKLFGSTTGSSGSWVVLDTKTSYVFAAATVNFPLSQLSAGYTYFRLAANRISPSSSTGDLGPAELIIYGYSSLVSSTQDFYADERGNLLTAPVVGQSLANWLGGETGYVTTWYDQSGQGKDLVQPTAANQGIINTATSPCSLIFNGTSTNMYNSNFTFNFGPTFNYTIRAVVNNTVGGCLLYRGINGFGWSGGGMKKWWLGTQNGAEGTTGGYPNHVGYSEGYVYGQSAISSSKSSVTWSSSGFSSVALYENASAVTVSYSRGSPYTDQGTYLYVGTGGGSAYYNGNIYEIEIFSTPLSVSDVTIMG
jgi:hypothetical protein